MCTFVRVHVFMDLLRCESRPLQRRRESESQRSGNSDGRGKYQHTPIEREARRAHGLGYKPFKKSHGGKGESESGKRTERGKHQALGKELRDQPSATRAKRSPYRDFPAARRATRKQKIRQIDARDQQYPPGAHNSKTRAVRVLPAISSRKGTTITECGPRKSFAVTCKLNAAMDCLACSSVTPGLSRATMCASCQVKFLRIQAGNEAGIQMSMSREGMK